MKYFKIESQKGWDKQLKSKPLVISLLLNILFVNKVNNVYKKKKTYSVYLYWLM